MSTTFADSITFGPGLQKLVTTLSGHNFKSASREVKFPEEVDVLCGQIGDLIPTALAAVAALKSCSVTEQEEDGHLTVVVQKREEEEAKEVAAA